MPPLTCGRSSSSARGGRPSSWRTRLATATMSSRLSSIVPSRSMPMSLRGRSGAATGAPPLQIFHTTARVAVLGDLALAADRAFIGRERRSVVRDHLVRDAARNEQDVSGLDRDRVFVEVERDDAGHGAADLRLVVRVAAALEPRRYGLEIVDFIAQPGHRLGDRLCGRRVFARPFEEFHAVGEGRAGWTGHRRGLLAARAWASHRLFAREEPRRLAATTFGVILRGLQYPGGSP